MPPALFPVLRYLRVPLVVTVWSHLLAGGLVTGLWPVPLWTGFTCVYLFGMAHNDWVDRESDRKAKPSRPLPSGALSEGSARILMSFLLFGIGLSYLAGSVDPEIENRALWMPFSLACAWTYNTLKGRHPVSAAMLLGMARACVWLAFLAIPALITGLAGALITLWSTTEEAHPWRRTWTLRFLLTLPILDACHVMIQGIRGQSIWVMAVFPILSMTGLVLVRLLAKPFPRG
ncbi:MAG: UbiA family prenyltransferase [Planctomycetota bacterium]